MKHVKVAFVGLLFGAVLSSVGFTSWDRVHAMFLFSDHHLLYAFLLAVGVLAPSWEVIRRVQHPKWPVRRFHPGILPGSLLFGIGWSLSGACPAVAFAQIGEGQMGAALTVVGIVMGNALYPRVHARYFRWVTGSCQTD